MSINLQLRVGASHSAGTEVMGSNGKAAVLVRRTPNGIGELELAHLIAAAPMQRDALETALTALDAGREIQPGSITHHVIRAAFDKGGVS